MIKHIHIYLYIIISSSSSLTVIGFPCRYYKIILNFNSFLMVKNTQVERVYLKTVLVIYGEWNTKDGYSGLFKV